MLFSIAWKNIWRNKLRSLIIIAAIAVGLLAGLVVTGLTIGAGEQIISTTITTRISHLQITHPLFREERSIGYYVPDALSLADEFRDMDVVRAASPRILADGMASSPHTAQGVQLIGVIPEYERDLTIIDQSIVDGEYFDPQFTYGALIGEELADRLRIGTGSRLVLTFQDAEGFITGGAFRISGLFRTPSTEFDRTAVFLLAGDLAEHLGTDLRFQQVSVLFESIEVLDMLHSSIEEMVPDLRLETWRDLAPEIEYIYELMTVFLYIFMVIILLALAFGIVNTMLMVVLERRREIGMLSAVGMKRRLLFSMIVLETVALSITGAVTGLILTFITMSILSGTGIDLATFAEGLREMGVTEIIYPQIPWSMYPVLTLIVIAIAVLSSIYPAQKALRMNPAEALRMS